MIDHAKRYSSQASMRLSIAGLDFDVTQITNGTPLYSQHTQGIEESDEGLIIKVDGRETCQRISLPHGISRSTSG
jgi:hypothetical protein